MAGGPAAIAPTVAGLLISIENVTGFKSRAPDQFLKHPLLGPSKRGAIT
jgi:hypothetical protein